MDFFVFLLNNFESDDDVFDIDVNKEGNLFCENEEESNKIDFVIVFEDFFCFIFLEIMRDFVIVVIG